MQSGQSQLCNQPKKYKLAQQVKYIFIVYIFKMSNHQKMTNNRQPQNKFQLFIVYLLTFFLTQADCQCPAPSIHGFVISGRITAALGDGIVQLSQTDDYLCYNYTLAYRMERVPEIAVSLQGFQLEKAKKMYFYVKPMKSDSYTSIPFIIRMQWAYAKWSQLTFNFLAQDRTDIQSGYYQIDTELLSSCLQSAPKQSQQILPFRTTLSMKQQLQHSIFLHGFQLTTSPSPSPTFFSPLQLQLAQTWVNQSGIVIRLRIDSATRADTVYIGYVIVQAGRYRYEIGNYTYAYSYEGLGVPAGGIVHETAPIGRNYARIYGISGFNVGGPVGINFSFTTVWNSFSFTFQFKQFNQYVRNLTYSYLFFIGSDCDNCPGFPYSNSGTCVNVCPANTVLTAQNFCINCGVDKVWNGSTCAKLCPKNQYLNPSTDQCQCPPGMHWSQQYCIICTNGKIFSQQTKTCQCPKNLGWNGIQCSLIPQCYNGKIWDVYTYSCQCPEMKYWNGTECSQLPTCLGGQVLNLQYQCVCKENFYWNGQICNFSPCLGGQLWTGSSCTCPIGLNFNGSKCIQCINGQRWNKITSKCQCQGGYKWNGILCQKSYICQGNRVWNETYQQCICNSGNYWSGYRCVPIPSCAPAQYFDIISLKCVCLSDFKWDGTNCVNCINGKVWNFTILKCVCPFGTIESAKGCVFQQICTGGKIWIGSLMSCECPTSAIWNGNNCIANPCNNGKIWNQQFKSCQCPNRNVFINGSCLPAQISCTNGRVWNPIIYACQCPPGTFANIARCDEIPKCDNGKVYNPITNLCNCPFGLIEGFQICTPPKCGQGQFYNGFVCQVINCPPPSYFYNNRCVYGLKDKNCNFAEYWNGHKCVYYPNRCPLGTVWQNLRCSSSGLCPADQYILNGKCTPLSQQCQTPLIWDGKGCKMINSQCPNGTFRGSNGCQPYQPCKGGAVWDATFMRCLCLNGTFSNGVDCISCGQGKVWYFGVGCQCAEGAYDIGGTCQIYNQKKCQAITNSYWKNGKCLCRPGFTKVGLQCLCYGLQIGDLCDRCSYMPNSQWNALSNSCQCMKGYIQVYGNCIFSAARSAIGADSPKTCSVSTYFNMINKMCIPCPDGCLSCLDSYRCQLCRPEFLYDSQTQKCFQICGDSKKFTLQCDDGNNLDGDGCSRDCRVESGFVCSGGSPETSDICYISKPDQIKIQLMGQIRQQSSITLTIKLNYMPRLLLTSPDCQSSCNVLTTNITSGDKSAISIITKYIKGTEHIFSISIQYGKPYIASFDIQIGINPIQAIKYFGRVSTLNSLLTVSVNPSYLALLDPSDRIG